MLIYQFVLITIRLLPSANKVAAAFVGLRYVSHGISEMVNQYNQITNLNNLHDNKINNKVTKFDKSIKLNQLILDMIIKKYLKI